MVGLAFGGDDLAANVVLHVGTLSNSTLCVTVWDCLIVPVVIVLIRK